MIGKYIYVYKPENKFGSENFSIETIVHSNHFHVSH